MDITKAIKDNLSSMTKSEYKVAVYCLGNLNNLAFDTLDVTAAKIGISTTSVIRFCRAMGFDGYKAFQNCVRDEIGSQPNLPDKFHRTVTDGSSDGLFVRTVQQSIACIEKTVSQLSTETISEVTALLSSAERVFCFGMKESFALAHYTYTRLLTVRKDVFLLSAGYNSEVEGILGLNKGDVCMVYLFHRYTRTAYEILQILKQRGVRVILVTSAPYDSIEDMADLIIACHVDTNGIKNSAIAPVCIADYLCNAVAAIRGEETLQYMKESEKLFDKFIF